jgi:hypothetical protein
MTKIRTGVLIEVASIQEYIFTSNKLKENVGASYIIEKLLFGENGPMDATLKEVYGEDFNINLWKKFNDVDDESPCEVGYIGGGNCLIFFKESEKAINFIKNFSKVCLLKFPTLRLLFGLRNDFDLNKYPESFRELLGDLKKRKAEYKFQVSVPKHGITADCPLSNDAAEVYDNDLDAYISMTSASKLEASKIAFSNQNELYKCLAGRYVLPDKIDDLGQEIEGSYIAVVHIDGNGMGNVFSKISLIRDLRRKSDAVSRKAFNAMDSLIEHIIDLKENEKLLDLNIKGEILPIRPILVGGDDITFLCEGRLGMYLAEKFIRLFYNDHDRSLDNSEKLMDGACAGVAIVKSHFPFYKAVKLAEELCAEAKKVSRLTPGSYISFYYSSTTFSGSPEMLRQRTHKTESGNLSFGPYLLFDESKSNSIEKLKEGIKLFKGLTYCHPVKNPAINLKWPRNKVMKLREILTDSASSQKLFEKEMAEIELSLPLNKKTIWDNSKTPVFDQIELMDFYLDNLL